MAIRPASHYFPITVLGEERLTRIAETNDGTSPDYDFGEDYGQSSRTFYTAWEQNDDSLSQQIRNDILGYTYIAAEGGVKYLARTSPIGHPDYPETMHASSVRISGRKGTPDGRSNTGVQQFDEALLSVSYSQLPYQIYSDRELKAITGTFPDEGSLLRFVSLDQQTAAKYQTIPAFGNLVWDIAAGAPGALAPDGKPQSLTLKATTILFEGDVVITWHEVPYDAYPISAINHLVGKTNSSPFGHPLSIPGVYPAKTLVCGPPRKKMRRLRDGSLGFDITYAFKYYPLGANTFFYAGPLADTGYYPARNINGSLLYPLDGVGKAMGATFEDLFRPEP